MSLKDWLGIIVFSIVAILILVSVFGCHFFAPPTTSISRVVDESKAAAAAQPLVWVFICSAVIAMLSLFNGSKSASGWLAASIFGLGLSVMVAEIPDVVAWICLIGSGLWFARSVIFKRKGWLFNWTFRKEKKDER